MAADEGIVSRTTANRGSAVTCRAKEFFSGALKGDGDITLETNVGGEISPTVMWDLARQACAGAPGASFLSASYSPIQSSHTVVV